MSYVYSFLNVMLQSEIVINLSEMLPSSDAQYQFLTRYTYNRHYIDNHAIITPILKY
jgi:hypothetical protein